MTKKRFLFICIFIATLSFALLVGGTLPYFIFYAFLLTFLIPLIHGLIILFNLKADINVPEGFFYVGEKLPVEYKIKNNSIFFLPYIKIVSSMAKKWSGEDPKEIIFNLSRKSSYIHKETLIMKRRGYYELGEIEVSLKDVFGFFSLKKRVSTNTSITIYPDPTNLNTFQIPRVGQLGDLLVNSPIFQDRSRVASLRDYREGDSIKSIHWKLWPKSEDLLVKDYENRGDTNVGIFVDNYSKNFKNDLDRRLEDKIVDVSISIVNYYLREHVFVSLTTQNYDKEIIIEGDHSTHIKPFLEHLARFEANGNTPFNNFIISKISLLKKDSTLIIISSILDKSMGALGILLKSKNINPLFVIINHLENKAGFLDLEIENKLRKENIPIYILSCNSDIKEALEG